MTKDCQFREYLNERVIVFLPARSHQSKHQVHTHQDMRTAHELNVFPLAHTGLHFSHLHNKAAAPRTAYQVGQVAR